ncbi:hypothetical protein JWS13_38990 [Rhodococcus pseudokoreensis]|uniref:Glycine zipper n=1 Tax=Rhodococcus pseudokoreensis TaxID=2811421 RepID=A0A974ZXN3_9NOCA|nr:hypothetical protein [Rhodococcus pseudokoreensis]QSE94165.1 hypothetical protein JWS13_38990 [Rhodococcus pseudokoreensis]
MVNEERPAEQQNLILSAAGAVAGLVAGAAVGAGIALTFAVGAVLGGPYESNRIDEQGT